MTTAEELFVGIYFLGKALFKICCALSKCALLIIILLIVMGMDSFVDWLFTYIGILN